MPTKVNVRVNTINHTTQTSAAGFELNYIEITGFNESEGKGFKKRFFSTKKDGTATKNAETADTLVKDDWIEIMLDDTSYKNVQTLKKIAAPVNATAPSQAAAPSSAPASSGGGSKMSKADWAEKDRAKNESIARSVALRAAVDFIVGSADSSKVSTVIEVAKDFESYLLGSSPKLETAPNGNTIVNATPANTVENVPTQTDDDIPF